MQIKLWDKKIKKEIFYLYDIIIQKTKIKTYMGYILILFQFIILYLTFIEKDDEFIFKYLNKNQVQYFFFILPYKLIPEYDLYISLTITTIFLFFLIYIIFSFFKIRQKKSEVDYIRIFSLFLCIFEYVLYPIIFGVILDFFFRTEFLLDYSLIFKILNGINLIFFSLIWVSIIYFFFDFFTYTKNPLSRFQNYHYIFIRFSGIIIIFFDIFLKEDSNKQKWMVILNLLNLGLIMASYILNITYYNYNLNVFYGFMICLYFWILLSYFFSSVLPIQIISDYIFLFISLGFIFLVWTFLVSKNFFFYYLLTNNNKNLLNNNYFDKRMRYLMQISEKTEEKNNELFLTSILQLHIQDCQNMSCCCKKRREDISVSKDTKFIRNYIIENFKKKLKKNQFSHVLRMNYIIFLLEKNDNFAYLNEEIRIYENYFYKNLPLFSEFGLYRIKLKFEKNLNKFNFGIDTEKFEKIKKYDELNLKLEKLVLEVLDDLQIFWDALKVKNYKINKIEQLFFSVIKKKSQIEELFKKIENLKNDNAKIIKTIIFFYLNIFDNPLLNHKYDQKLKVS